MKTSGKRQDMFPWTYVTATEMLTNHRWDIHKSKSQLKKEREQQLQHQNNTSNNNNNDEVMQAVLDSAINCDAIAVEK